MKTTFKENLFAFVIAFVLALGVVTLINNTDMLQANINALEEKQNTQKQKIQGDIVYQMSGDKLIVQSSKDFQGLQSLSMSLSYNPDKLSLDVKKFDSTFQTAISSQKKQGLSNVVFTNVGKINADQKILEVQVGKDIKKDLINISDVVITSTDGTAEDLSVSNIN